MLVSRVDEVNLPPLKDIFMFAAAKILWLSCQIARNCFLFIDANLFQLTESRPMGSYKATVWTE